MDYLSLIKQPIEAELADFIDLFNKSLMHSDGLLSQVLDHIRQRAGKRMRPMLILLMARNFGKISTVTQHSAVGLELLHTASLGDSPPASGGVLELEGKPAGNHLQADGAENLLSRHG